MAMLGVPLIRRVMQIEDVRNTELPVPGGAKQEQQKLRRGDVHQIVVTRRQKLAARAPHGPDRSPANASDAKRAKEPMRRVPDLMRRNVGCEELRAILVETRWWLEARIRRQDLGMPAVFGKSPDQLPCPLHVGNHRRRPRTGEDQDAAHLGTILVRAPRPSLA
jgi:hypothetical protein